MITVLPVEEPSAEALRLLNGASGTVLEAREAGALLGVLAARQEKQALRITAFAVPGLELPGGQARGAWEVAELMLRAAASYGRNRGLAALICGKAFPEMLLRRFNFVQIAEDWRLETAGFLSGCKNCEKS